MNDNPEDYSKLFDERQDAYEKPKPFSRIVGDIISVNENKKGVVYEALYNDNIHESAAGTLSIHKTREGAQKAIDYHKMEQLAEFNKFMSDISEEEQKIMNFKFGEHEWWGIRETEIFE